jgi:hypothetical protein
MGWAFGFIRAGLQVDLGHGRKELRETVAPGSANPTDFGGFLLRKTRRPMGPTAQAFNLHRTAVRLLLVTSPIGHEGDLLTPKLDLELIAGLQAQRGGVEALPTSRLPLNCTLATELRLRPALPRALPPSIGEGHPLCQAMGRGALEISIAGLPRLDSVATPKRFGAPNPGGGGRIARYGSPLPWPDSARRQ